jgi:PAS domain S-box-containing protein
MSAGLALFIGLFSNLALLVILVAVYGFLLDRLASRGIVWRQVVLGFTFGLFVLGCMQMGIPVYTGSLVDLRNAFVILAGAFGGPLAALIAAGIGAAYRVTIGGLGIPTGVLGLGLAVLAGSSIFTRKRSIDSPWKAALVALAAAILVLPGFLLSAGMPGDFRALAKTLALPYGAATAVGVFAGMGLLIREERRHEAQMELKESAAKYRELFESILDVVYRIDEEEKLSIISPSCEGILGYSPAELVGRTTREYYADPGRYEEMRAALRRGETVVDFEAELVRKDGSTVMASVNACAIRDASGSFRGIHGVLRDTSRLKETEDALRASLAEREALLMELFHRTNNNMQVISSFLKLQAEALGDPKVEALAQNVSSRIHAMSLVYEKLYRSKNLSRINAREYIEELVPLIEAYGSAPDGKVRVAVDAEDIDFLIDSAVPLGLVISEIVGNAFKHAFPGDRRGSIGIGLRRLDEKTILLEIADDGVGLPPGFDPLSTSSFGISTMLSIVRLQMRGEAEVRNGRGLSYRIRMRDRLYEERV